MKNNNEIEPLNVESDIVEIEKVENDTLIKPIKNDDIKRDYEYTRANLY